MLETSCPHDATYKNLFKDPDMVESMLRRFAPADIVAEMDFHSLEPFPTEHVTDDMRERRNDIVWRIRIKDSVCESVALSSGISEQGRLVDGCPNPCLYRAPLAGYYQG